MKNTKEISVREKTSIMKKSIFIIITMLCTMVQGAWATDYNVDTDEELRAAIQNNGANITVTANIDLSNSTLSIGSDLTVTIDLSGHTLDRQLTQRGEGGGQVITVRSGATLNLSNGTLKGGWGGNGGGLVNEGGTATLTGVTITGCVADDRGGGISNGAGGTLTLTGCTITGNTSNDKTAPKGGGGIYNAGTLNMLGTNTIKDNWKTNGIRSNLYLKNGTLINITGSLADSKVFVDMETLGTFTSGYSTYNDGHPAGFFTADKEAITGMRLVNGEALLEDAIPEGGVYYIERSWNETAKRVEATYHTLEENQYITLTGSDDDTYLDPGWYVVKGSDVVYDDFLYMNGGGEYHLILCDGASIKAMFFIVESPNILHIHGQTDNTGKMISTYVYNFIAHKCAGIGGTYHNANGPIFIHGGDIDVHATLSSAGIGGGGYTSQGGPITIYGGTVHTEGGWEPGGNVGETTGGGAGIGGGRNGDGGVVNIYGGSVYATGRGSTTGGAGIGSGSYADNSGTISIYGGYVEANGYDGAAGIGGGTGTNGADVTIHGGTVKAEGKSEGPGIGAGKNDNERITYAGTLTVTGGKVYAEGATRGAGIGGGWSTNGSSVTVSGGYVSAKGGQYAAGIGSGCEHSSEENLHGGTLTVTGGYVEAHGGEDGAGIGGGEDGDGATVSISGGEVRAYGNCYGAGIGGGEDGKGGNVTITGGIVIVESGGDQRAIGAGYGSDNHGSLSFADNLGVFVTTDLYRSQKANRVKDCREYKYVRVNKCAHGGAVIAIVSGEKHGVTGCDYCYADQEDHSFNVYGECGDCHLIGLIDNADNSGSIAHWDDQTKSVTTGGRTLYKDGDWNTLCLPFDIDDISVSPLAGATVKELDTEGIYDTDKQTGYDPESGTLYLYFKDATKIEAGKPYLVEWASGSDIVSPLFTDVTLYADLPTDVTSEDGKVQFVGNYDPVVLTGGDKSNYYLGSGNKMYWPHSNKTINSFRAYFHVNLEEGEEVQSCRLAFDEEEVTGIVLMEGVRGKREDSMERSTANEWYDLTGRRLSGRPTKSGFYIHGGRKVFVE